MLNLLEILFILLGASVTFLGSLVLFLEPRIPAIARGFRYGKFSAAQGPAGDAGQEVVKSLEISKSRFKDFYAFALLWGCLWLYLGVRTYVFGQPVPEFVHTVLDLLVSPSRTVKTTEASTLVALVLMFLQICRRFYETFFSQVFSKKAKINLSHYFVGFLHYYGVVLAILCHAPGFVAGSPLATVYLRELFDLRILLCAAVFLYAWTYQSISNVILINLRKNKSGAVVTEKHLMPHGSYFELVSSPHMFFEVVMYFALWALLYPNRIFVFVVFFVVSNQFQVARFTHKWYQETFPQYPKQRKAIIPYLY